MTANSPSLLKPSIWQVLLFLTLAFWLSSSVTLDGLVMPTLYTSGMMTEPGFASAGYSLFWAFNRIELLCAAAVLTSVLVLRYTRHPWHRPGQFTLVAAIVLLAIALLDTYGLTPAMGALGIQLNWFAASSEPSALMDRLHLSYWFLELLKLSTTGFLLWFYSRRSGLVSSVN
jgi:Domain of unknown function (DUF4149)